MDPVDTILATARDKVGCNGIRHFSDLGKMRQDTLERRFLQTQRQLTRGNMASVYAMWLRDQVTRIGGAERTKAVGTFCKFLDSWDFGKERTLKVWDDCIQSTADFPSWIDSNRMVGQMEAVREEIEHEYPISPGDSNTLTSNGRMLTPNKPMLTSNKPMLTSNKPMLTSNKPMLTSNDERKPRDMKSNASRQLPIHSREEIPYAPYKKKKKNSSAINLKEDKWAKGAEVEFVPSSTHREAVPSVPKNYICKRCGAKGHFVQDCPTNSDPAWDSRPPSKYICRICGAKGEHYITSCPKTSSRARSKTPKSSSPAYESPPKQDNSNIECIDRTLRRNEKQGRLSPWEENPGQQILYEAAELPYDQDEVVANHSAQDFLERFEESIVLSSPPTALWDSDMQTPQSVRGSTSFTPTPPNKRQKVQPFKYKRSEPLPRTFKSKDNEEPDLIEIVSNVVRGINGEIENLRSQNSQSSSPKSAPLATPVEPYVTLKSLAKNPPYDEIVKELFGSRLNPWIKTSSRTTALEMWDRREE